MRSAEIVIVAALLTGVAIGMWFQRGRIGGTEHMRAQRDSARRACDRARTERDEARALLRTRFANHPSAAPRPKTPVASTSPIVPWLHLVGEAEQA